MRVIDVDFNNILTDKKSYKNLLIYNISYKMFVVEKPQRIWLDKIEGFIKTDNENRYLILFECNEIYDKIRYLISKKSGIKYSISYNFPRIRNDSYNSLPIEKILTFHNVIILIKSIVNENKNHYLIYYTKRFVQRLENNSAIDVMIY